MMLTQSSQSKEDRSLFTSKFFDGKNTKIHIRFTQTKTHLVRCVFVTSSSFDLELLGFNNLLAQDGHYAELYNSYFRHQSLA